MIYWLMRLIYRFDVSDDDNLEKLADDCRLFAEKVSGKCKWLGLAYG